MSHLWVDFDEDMLFRVDKDLQEASFVERTVDEGEKLLMLKEENVRGGKRGKEAKDRASVCVCVRMWNVCVYGCSPKRHRLESAKPPEVWNIEPRNDRSQRPCTPLSKKKNPVEKRKHSAEDSNQTFRFDGKR